MPLSDDECYAVIHAALLALGREAGATVRGDTALDAARRMLALLQMGLLLAIENKTDTIHGIIETPR